VIPAEGTLVEEGKALCFCGRAFDIFALIERARQTISKEELIAALGRHQRPLPREISPLRPELAHC
jgi:hypothetical protein